MNISNLYDKSIKLIDDSYARLLKIWELPKGSISKKVINNHQYFYHQYREGKKIITKILTSQEINGLKKDINERKKLVKLNKEAKDNLNKNIKIIALFDKGLSASLMDEAFAYSFDEIPIPEREKVSLPFINSTTYNVNHINDNHKLEEYFARWKKGEIRARDISNYVIQKISD